MRTTFRTEQYAAVMDRITKDDLELLMKSFLALAHNPEPRSSLRSTQQICSVYVTLESIVRNFPKVFGYQCETFAVRFYNLLADGYNGKLIYFPKYALRLHPLIQDNPIHLNYFAFKILDG